MSSLVTSTYKLLPGLAALLTVSVALCAGAVSTEDHSIVLEGLHIGSDIEDAFSIGNVVFVYRRDALPDESEPVLDLAKLISVDRAATRGKPDALTHRILTTQCTIPLKFQLNEITAINRGGDGYWWRVKWDLFPKNGGSTGPPYRYTAYVAGDGTLIPCELAFCDAFDMTGPNENREHRLFSHLLFSAFSTSVKEDQILSGEAIRSRVELKLQSVLAARKEQGYTRMPNLRFRDQSLIEVPVKQQSDGTIVSRKVWATNFAKEDPDNKLIPTRDLLSIWTTIDGQVGKLTFDK